MHPHPAILDWPIYRFNEYIEALLPQVYGGTRYVMKIDNHIIVIYYHLGIECRIDNNIFISGNSTGSALQIHIDKIIYKLTSTDDELECMITAKGKRYVIPIADFVARIPNEINELLIKIISCPNIRLYHGWIDTDTIINNLEWVCHE